MRIGLLMAIMLALSGTALAEDATIPLPGNPPVRVHGPLDVAKQLVATEQAFAARSLAAGFATACREFMDPTDGLSFEGKEPVRGAEAIFQAQGGGKPGGTLNWTPAEVFAAKGGDMGAVWGHYRFTLPADKAKPAVTGKYVTVWRKDGDGHWKGVIDIGNPD